MQTGLYLTSPGTSLTPSLLIQLTNIQVIPSSLALEPLDTTISHLDGHFPSAPSALL